MPMFEKPHATFSGKIALLLFIFFFSKGFSLQNFFQKSFFFWTSPPPLKNSTKILQNSTKILRNSTKKCINSTKIILQNSTKFYEILQK